MLAGFFILLIMWALEMISSYIFGGATHLLLVFALIVLVIPGAGPLSGLNNPALQAALPFTDHY